MRSIPKSSKKTEREYSNKKKIVISLPHPYVEKFLESLNMQKETTVNQIPNILHVLPAPSKLINQITDLMMFLSQKNESNQLVMPSVFRSKPQGAMPFVLLLKPPTFCQRALTFKLKSSTWLEPISVVGLFDLSQF